MPRGKGKKQPSDGVDVSSSCGGGEGTSCGADGGASAAAAGGDDGSSCCGEQTKPRADSASKNSNKKRRQKQKKRENAKQEMDFEVENLMYQMLNPNTNEIESVKLMDYLVEDAARIYPNIGSETYRVPYVHINAIQESDELVSNQKPARDSDLRSDRAESLIGDCMDHLSKTFFSSSVVGPFFIITSYEYEHYLARLKKFMEIPGVELSSGVANTPPDTIPQEKCNLKGTSTGTSSAAPGATAATQKQKKRGEMDMVILCRNHVVLVEIKALGDNLEKDANPEMSIKSKLTDIVEQLQRYKHVFDHIMEGVLKVGSPLRISLVAALPNLELKHVEKCFKDNLDLDKIYKNNGIKILTKDAMPQDRMNVTENFDKFQQWWIVNVFSYAVKDDGSVIPVSMEALTLRDDGGASMTSADCGGSSASAVPDMAVCENLSLKRLKSMVGRYVGLLSVVQVSRSGKFSPYRVEARTTGQAVKYIGKRFSCIVLTPEQRQHVECDLSFGYLHGPPGSGKTVVLALRARRWILQDNNFVVIINMYRGSNQGRVIGKQMYKTVTQSMTQSWEKLEKHCIEFTADVDSFDEEDMKKLCHGISHHFGSDLGENGRRLLFIVDETYVQYYWDSIYNFLRGNFANSSMWCAGLFGKEPDGFTPLKLKKVMRCPPKIQALLKLLDWDEERKKCYITDSTQSVDDALPTDGANVLVVRHYSSHKDFSHLHPSQCPECGQDLVKILEELNVEKPESPHQRGDQKQWSLRCSDILFLVGLPRSVYKPDLDRTAQTTNPVPYIDTTISEYRKNMSSYINCPMLKAVQNAGFPVRVHTELSCPGLLDIQSAGQQMQSGQDARATPLEELNVTWVYTYQGMENTVIVFLPGDHAIPSGDNIPTYWTNARENIPCPGLRNDEKKKDGGQTAASPVEGVIEDEMNSSSSEDEGDEKQEYSHYKAQPRPALRSMFFKKGDLDMLGRWDKNNLLIAASRSTSLLVMVTCGKAPQV